MPGSRFLSLQGDMPSIPASSAASAASLAGNIPQQSPFQNPHPSPNTSPNPNPQSESHQALLDKAIDFTSKALRELTSAGEAISGYTVARHVLSSLDADSWHSLGIQIKDVEPLSQIFEKERRVSDFVDCFLMSRGIVTLHELKLEICKHEGVHDFEELMLGPFLRHPAVTRYFLLPPDQQKLVELTKEDVITALGEILDEPNQSVVSLDELLTYIAKKIKVDRTEELGVCIKDLSALVRDTREARRGEQGILKAVKKLLKRSCYFRGEEDALSLIPNKKRKNSIAEVLELVPSGSLKWRGSSEDFISVTRIQRTHPGSSSAITDWVSMELVRILSILSSTENRSGSIYLLKTFDKVWDKNYSDKVFMGGEKAGAQSSFVKSLREARWVASTADEDLHYPGDLFYDCADVRLLLGANAPYAMPQLVLSKSLVKEVGFKTEVSPGEALSILSSWATTQLPLKAHHSVDQMSRLYSYISEGISNSMLSLNQNFLESPFIFTPLQGLLSSDVSLGEWLSRKEVYWLDPTGCFKMIKELALAKRIERQPCRMLAAAYPGLHDFFVRLCGVPDLPPFTTYVDMLRQLSTGALPSEASHVVCRVIMEWMNALKSGAATKDDILKVKKLLHQKKYTVLPTVRGKWVSLHESFGLTYWVDDENLMQQYGNVQNVNLLKLSEVRSDSIGEVALILQILGIPAVSKVVQRTRDKQKACDRYRVVVPASKERKRFRMKKQENSRNLETGRQGEMAAYRYFRDRLGPGRVRWVNEQFETGLPYDLVIVGDRKRAREYVEVKATLYARKDWFDLTMREWQFACEKRGAYTIAHVILLGSGNASVCVMKDPYSLCKKHTLRLGICMSGLHRDTLCPLPQQPPRASRGTALHTRMPGIFALNLSRSECEARKKI